MVEAPAYAVAGRGRHGRRMLEILEAVGRRVAPVERTRRAAEESDGDYRTRMAAAWKSSGARIAWLCLPPADVVPLLVDSALDAGLDVIAEKPWFVSPPATDALTARARAGGRLIGVHFEYCLLDAVEEWRRRFAGGAGLRFSGTFHHDRGGHLGLRAMDDLGVHLLAIRRYAARFSELGGIDCAYGSAAARRVSVASEDGEVSSLDFTTNREPIIQRFIARFEAALGTGSFPLDLPFALAVSSQAAGLA